MNAATWALRSPCCWSRAHTCASAAGSLCWRSESRQCISCVWPLHCWDFPHLAEREQKRERKRENNLVLETLLRKTTGSRQSRDMLHDSIGSSIFERRVLRPISYSWMTNSCHIQAFADFFQMFFRYLKLKCHQRASKEKRFLSTLST